MLTIDILFPLMGIHDGNEYYDFIVILVFLFHITVSCGIFSWYLGGPLLFVMSWISRLSQGEYDPPRNIFNRRGKLKSSYKLYREVIFNIQSLSTSLKKAEKERTKLEEAKKDWIAGISHDLKTPLTYITGYSTLLLNETYSWSNEEKESFLHEIHNKCQHLENLVQDLNYSIQINNYPTSLVPLQLQKANIVEFMKNLLADTWNDPHAQSYNLEFHFVKEYIPISFDKRLLYRALQNLLMNAILHNPPATNVHVTLSMKNEHFISITIADNGVGMDQETLNNLFQKYYRGTTTNSPEYGTGLGMAIVKNLILAHGGHITVESEVSKGTTFCIQLPINPPDNNKSA